MKKDKRKIIFILSLLIMVIATSTIWAFLKINNKAVEIQASRSEFNTELEENEHMHLEEDINGEKVPVPNGYVGSKADGENGIDTGYVIYEGEEEVTNENVEESQKTRNQYVWVPVPDASKMYGTDANSKRWGKIYYFSANRTNPDTDQVTGAYPKNWSESNGKMTILAKAEYREPDIVKSWDTDSKLKNLNISLETAHEFLNQLEREFNEMIDSVEKYGGFYIGRYETGDLNKEKVVIVKQNTNISGQTGYIMNKKIKGLKNGNTNIETGMIWGCQWDRTLMWLVESGSKTKNEIAESSASWANYQTSEFEFIDNNGSIIKKESGNARRIPTGSTEYTKANNIYDLAGNVRECTNTSYQNGSRVAKGYGFYDYGNVTSIIHYALDGRTFADLRLPSNAIYKINYK